MRRHTQRVPPAKKQAPKNVTRARHYISPSRSSSSPSPSDMLRPYTDMSSSSSYKPPPSKEEILAALTSVEALGAWAKELLPIIVTMHFIFLPMLSVFHSLSDVVLDKQVSYARTMTFVTFGGADISSSLFYQFS